MAEPRVRLGEIADLNPEALGAKASPDLEFGYIDLSSVSRGSINRNLVNRYRLRDAPSRARRVVRAGDVLFGTVRPQLQSHARVKDEGSIASTGFCVVRPRNGVSDGSFLGHFLLSDEASRQAAQCEVGSNYPAVTERDVASFWLPRFSLQEQQRIAEVLDSIDESIQATERLIAKLGCVRDAIVEDTFGRLAGARMWHEVSLADVARFQTGRAFPSSGYGAVGVPLLRPGNFRDSEFIEWTERHTTRLAPEWAKTASGYVVRPGEIVMNLTAQSLEGGFLGRVAMVPDSEPTCLLNQRIARLTGTSAHASFLFWALRSPAVRSQINRRGQGTKVQHLYDRDLKSLLFSIPEHASDQVSAVAPIWGTVNRLGAESIHLSKLRRTRSGLSADLLSGRARAEAA